MNGKAVQDGCIKCFNMRKGPADGVQDLSFWTREVDDVVREIMEDPIFKGNQKYSFQLDLDEARQVSGCMEARQMQEWPSRLVK